MNILRSTGFDRIGNGGLGIQPRPVVLVSYVAVSHIKGLVEKSPPLPPLPPLCLLLAGAAHFGDTIRRFSYPRNPSIGQLLDPMPLVIPFH